jgi:hypothetical protein
MGQGNIQNNNITKIQNVTPFGFKFSYSILYFTIGLYDGTAPPAQTCPLGGASE